MFKMDEALKAKNNKLIETRLVCPCCHMGFIEVREIKKEYLFPSDLRKFIVPTNYPTCNRCCSRFEVEIDNTLKIKIKSVEH